MRRRLCALLSANVNRMMSMKFKQICPAALYFFATHIVLVLVVCRIVYYHFPNELDYDRRIMIVIIWIVSSCALWFCMLMTAHLLSKVENTDDLRSRIMDYESGLWGIVCIIILLYEGAFGYPVLVPSMISKTVVYPIILWVDCFLCLQACKKLES